jgi:hypothetical protein
LRREQKTRHENTILAGKRLICGKDKMETEKKLNQWNVITKECVSKMSTDRISRILHTNMRIKSNVTIVKHEDKCTYLGSEINSEGNIYGEIIRI